MSASRIRVHTMSGAFYVFDRDAMTWERVHPTRDIDGLEGINSGRLDKFPEYEVGESMHVYGDGAWIRTTPVVRVEDIS